MFFPGSERPITLDEAKESVGKGWHSLLDVVFNALSVYYTAKTTSTPHPYVSQVKEKFGRLRVYIENSDEFADGIVVAVEKMSACICEDCGRPGTIGGATWLRVTCEEHRAKDQVKAT